MAEILSLQHERVDDVPLIIGVANRLGLADLLNRHLGTHASQQGLHNGQLAVGWLGYILSQADHHKSAVRDWANGLAHTLRHLLGQPIRDVDLIVSVRSCDVSTMMRLGKPSSKTYGQRVSPCMLSLSQRFTSMRQRARAITNLPQTDCCDSDIAKIIVPICPNSN